VVSREQATLLTRVAFRDVIHPMAGERHAAQLTRVALGDVIRPRTDLAADAMVVRGKVAACARVALGRMGRTDSGVFRTLAMLNPSETAACARVPLGNVVHAMAGVGESARLTRVATRNVVAAGFGGHRKMPVLWINS
jgi:hypothetical protein